MEEQGQEQAVDIEAKIDAKLNEFAAKLEKQTELSKLSDEEQAKAEFEREKVKFEAAKVLTQRSLPIEFVEYLIDADNEKTLKRITTFEKAYKSAIHHI